MFNNFPLGWNIMQTSWCLYNMREIHTSYIHHSVPTLYLTTDCNKDCTSQFQTTVLQINLTFLATFLQGVPKNAPIFQLLPTKWGRFFWDTVYIYYKCFVWFTWKFKHHKIHNFWSKFEVFIGKSATHFKHFKYSKLLGKIFHVLI